MGRLTEEQIANMLEGAALTRIGEPDADAVRMLGDLMARLTRERDDWRAMADQRAMERDSETADADLWAMRDAWSGVIAERAMREGLAEAERLRAELAAVTATLDLRTRTMRDINEALVAAQTRAENAEVQRDGLVAALGQCAWCATCGDAYEECLCDTPRCGAPSTCVDYYQQRCDAHRRKGMHEKPYAPALRRAMGGAR